MSIFVIFLSSLIFFLAVAFDISPYLRGPAPYPPEWRWPYQFINTMGKIWFPLIVIVIILAFIVYLEKTNNLRKNEMLVLTVLMILGFLFQLSILYFSRAGIGVLFHRVANPKLNGYFTASLNILNIGNFLKNYDKTVLSLPMHTIGHPPGTILIFWIINKIASSFSFLTDFINRFTPIRGDVRNLWLSLTPPQRLTAATGGPLFSFFSTLTIIPLYFLGKQLYGKRVALRASILYLFIPSLNLFIPLPDVVFPLFSTTSLLFFSLGIKRDRPLFFALSGFFIALGIFFTLGILPIFVLSLLLFTFNCFNDKKRPFASRLKPLISYFSGIILPFLLLRIFFQFDIFKVGTAIMKGGIAHRSYIVWLFYNLWDFFIFAGIPVSVMFILCFKQSLSNRLKKIGRIDCLLWSYSFMLLILNFSGASRAEAGRIWLLLTPPLILLTTNFLTKSLRFSLKFFIYFLVLQAAQILVMQEFWVTLW